MAATCLPGDGFAFPRSYCQGLYVRHEPGTFTWDGELLQFVVGVPPNALCKVYFDDRFVPWNSNRWTLDHVTTNATYTTIPGGVTADLPFFIQWLVPPGKQYGHLLIDTGFGALYDFVELPIAPDEYWYGRPFS